MHWAVEQVANRAKGFLPDSAGMAEGLPYVAARCHHPQYNDSGRETQVWGRPRSPLVVRVEGAASLPAVRDDLQDSLSEQPLQAFLADPTDPGAMGRVLCQGLLCYGEGDAVWMGLVCRSRACRRWAIAD